ncbi:hypothetical protein [Nostoc sp.]|uniref:hypothetical protein n=1 Tax=Nostoc sp. TaxID=1180 RepID=UPI002FF624EE
MGSRVQSSSVNPKYFPFARLAPVFLALAGPALVWEIQERQRAKQERQGAEQAEQKAARLAQRLREMGINPEEL